MLSIAILDIIGSAPLKANNSQEKFTGLVLQLWAHVNRATIYNKKFKHWDSNLTFLPVNETAATEGFSQNNLPTAGAFSRDVVTTFITPLGIPVHKYLHTNKDT